MSEDHWHEDFIVLSALSEFALSIRPMLIFRGSVDVVD